MCSLDPTRSKLALTRVRFDAEGPQVLPLSNQTEERRGEVTLHISQRSLITSFVHGAGVQSVGRERGPIVVFD